MTTGKKPFFTTQEEKVRVTTKTTTGQRGKPKLHQGLYLKKKEGEGAKRGERREGREGGKEKERERKRKASFSSTGPKEAS